jgi:uncharacterized protein Veg
MKKDEIWLNDVGVVILTFRLRQKAIDKEMGASVLTMTAKRGRKRSIVSIGQCLFNLSTTMSQAWALMTFILKNKIEQEMKMNLQN